MVIVLGACDPVDDGKGLDELVTGEKVMRHLQEFNRIAEENNGNRSSGTSGYEASIQYVKYLLDSKFKVQEQEFKYKHFKELENPRMSIVSPETKDYEYNNDFSIVKYSGSGQVVSAEVVAVDVVMPPGLEANTSDGGCQEDDFHDKSTSVVDGYIGLIQRGSCAYGVKASNAEAAGAVGVIIYNEGQEGRQNLESATLKSDSEVTIPVLFASYAVGEELYNWIQAGEVRVSINVNVLNEERTTKNLLADTHAGRENYIVVVGAHLDSVENHGINDNGSGSAAILEIALQMYNRDVPPKNKVRFAFWGAEELGLLGSTYYVEKLSRNERRNIELYLNFDMLGSLNYVRFVYDSDESKSGNILPGGSEQIEEVFYDYFQEKDLPAEPIDLTGRSDHAPFAEIGIPVGGLSSGIGGQKTQEQVDNYGGDLGEPYDPCNHKSCDDITNINGKSLDELSRAAAYAVDYFARSSDAVKDCGEQKERTLLQRGWLTNESEYIGPLLRK